MEKRPLVICTDPGIDDFIALSMVLSKPEFDVLGMVALSGNCLLYTSPSPRDSH